MEPSPLKQHKKDKGPLGQWNSNIKVLEGHFLNFLFIEQGSCRHLRVSFYADGNKAGGGESVIIQYTQFLDSLQQRLK